MKELVFATNNKHKLQEVREMLDGIVEIKSLSDIGLEGDIPETADTLDGNALQKAQWVYERTGADCFADDTGLEVEALGGRPGVYSARYAGEHCSFDDNINKMLGEMKGETNRRACFRTVICLIENGKPVGGDNDNLNVNLNVNLNHNPNDNDNPNDNLLAQGSSTRSTGACTVNDNPNDNVLRGSHAQGSSTRATGDCTETRYFEGRVDGVILTERYGQEGFGYDPIFMPDRFAVSFAEMPLEVKNHISHRGRAVAKLVEYLTDNQ